MASSKVEIPDFRFAGAYYAQLLDALIAFKRENVPELTDESAFEPLMQMCRAFALVGHLSNTLLDVVANESTLRTARLPGTVRDMLTLIGEKLRPASPSQVEILYELASILAASTTISPAGAQSSTSRQGDSPAIFFEIPDAITVARTDRPGAVFTDNAGVFADHTAAAIAATPFAVFTAPDVSDAFYIGHASAMWNQIDLSFNVALLGIDGVWEYFDGDTDDLEPDDVTLLGPNLRFNLNDLLGVDNRAGVVIRVRLASSTAFEDRVSQWDGTHNFITTAALLGQSSPSVSAGDYIVGSEWQELALATDETVGLATDGAIKYALPQDLDRNWRKTTVNSVTAFFLRFRIIAIATPTSPTVATLSISGGKTFVIAEATQGRTQAETLGSSNGNPSQSFTGTKTGFVDGSVQVSVDGDPWDPVDNFLASKSTDKHYVVTTSDDGKPVVLFGDGAAGAIPAVGANNVFVIYRFGVLDDGNVGAGVVTTDKSGLAFVNKVSNPRAAAGWGPAEGSDAASLEQAKVRAPASLRTRNTAIGPDDVERLATSFIDTNGASPFGRALAVEEGFGPKTIELVLVTRGGGIPTVEQLQAIELYLNGDRFAVPRLPKRIVANQQVGARAYTPKPIDVTATIFGVYEEEQVRAALTALLQPEAVRADGVTYEWDFGGSVPTSRLLAEIFKSSPNTIRNVVLALPAVDVTLNLRELPTAGTFVILQG